MKIVMLCEFYSEKLEFQENLLVKYYRKHGHDVTVITSTFESVFDYYNDRHDKSAPARTYFDHGAKIVKLRYRYNIFYRLRAYTSIRKILEQERPDLIFVHDIMLNLPECVAYLRKRPDCRMIMDYHADYSNSGRKGWISLKVLHGIARKWFLVRARPFISRIFPIVPDSALFLHEIYGVPYSEMEVLPLGADVDLARAMRAQGERERMRKSHGYTDQDIVIFTGGKLEPKKRTELVFRAMSMLPDLRLHVVVVGEASETLADYKAELLEAAEGRPEIRFAGWLGKEDIYRHLAMSDLAVFPASQSVLWQQAIAMGLPLIGGNMGHQDLSYLNLANNLINLPPEDIRAECLADSIRAVAGNPDRMRAMGEGALKVASEQLDWNSLIARTLRFNMPKGAADPRRDGIS